MATLRKSILPANPGQWSAKSQRSVSSLFTSEYQDREYKCWSCGQHSVFTAEDQKHTYEVQKVPIDQQRILCNECWKRSLDIAKDLESSERQWAAEKAALKNDQQFLSQWLELLEQREHYVRYKPDTAKKNMLQKLLAKV
jgi:hypothetical protein